MQISRDSTVVHVILLVLVDRYSQIESIVASQTLAPQRTGHRPTECAEGSPQWVGVSADGPRAQSIDAPSRSLHMDSAGRSRVSRPVPWPTRARARQYPSYQGVRLCL
eukprot:1221711-Prymnesium_polylepis.1